VLGDADRAREPHVAGRGLQTALGDVGDHRGDEGVAEDVRDALRQELDARVVFAEGHVRTVLLGAADRYQNRRLAALDRRPQLRPRERFEEYRVGRLRGCGRGGADEKPQHECQRYTPSMWHRMSITLLLFAMFAT